MDDSRISFDVWSDLYADRVQTMRKSEVRDLFAALSRPGVIALSGGLPDISSLPLDQVAECARRCVAVEGLRSLQYGNSDGRIECRRTICKILAAQGVEADPDEMILTSGSQQALDFLGRVFLNSGDDIICEGPSYLGAFQAFSAYEPTVHTIDMDEEGIRTDLLEAKLKELADQGRKPKFIYVIPNFNNPAGITMSMPRRLRLLELARQYNTPVVEDDPYGLIRFEGEDLTRLKTLDPNVIYLGTTSKIFAPGLRLAWMVAPRHFLERINLAKSGSDLCTSPFNMILAEHYFNEVDWQAALEVSKSRYKERKDAMLAALAEFFPKDVTWTKPEGGLFLWVTFPPYLNTEQLLPRAIEEGVAFVPGVYCYPDQRISSSMRLCYSFETPERIHEAIRRLSLCVQDRMALYRAFLEAGALPESSHSESYSSAREC